MPASCVVPNCSTSKGNGEKNWSTFRVPKDDGLRAKWVALIPGVNSLKCYQRVCEKHFEEHLVIKHFVKHDNSGKLIAQVPLKSARLKPGAEPTLFAECTLRSRSPQQIDNTVDHSYACSFALLNPTNEIEDKIFKTPFEHASENIKSVKEDDLVFNKEKICIEDTICLPDAVSNEALNIEADANININDNREQVTKYTLCLFDTVSIEDLNIETDANVNFNDSLTIDTEADKRIQFSIDDIIQSQLTVENCIAKDDAEVAKLHNTSLHTTVIFDSLIFNLKAKSDENKFGNNISLELPKPWNVIKSITEKEETLLFSYAVITNDRGTERHVFEKTVILKSSRDISYEVYMSPANITGTKLPTELQDISRLPEILKRFKDLRVCEGIVAGGLDFLLKNTSLRTCISTDWRHKDCTMLSILGKRCMPCKKYSKLLSEKIKRMKKRENAKCISDALNPVLS